MTGVQFAAGGRVSFLRHRVQTGSKVYQASYPMGIWGCFPGGEVVGAWIWPLTSI